MERLSLTAKQTWAVALAAAGIAFAFALYTNHAWEDWYITFRVSKNLAMGHGLVFTPGERVHAFTSPLGTLIPALLAFVTANASDDLVLWLFRALGCSLLGASAVMLLRIARATDMFRLSAYLVVGLVVVDARIVDFSINGMESALMVFFLVATLHALTVPTDGFVVRLGASWAGLMWTRPDSFVYVGALALGCLLFRPPSPHFQSRWSMARKFLAAGLVTTLLYLPWLLWTWSYYGTPVPHTVVAKGLFHPSPGTSLLEEMLRFPWRSVFGNSSLRDTFMPIYHRAGGWPSILGDAAKVISVCCSYYWVLPFARPLGRAVSFATLLAHCYLTCVAANVAPWYLPSVTFLSLFVVGQIAEQATAWVAGRWGDASATLARSAKVALRATAGASLLASLATTLAMGQQLRLQQEIVESGNRKKVGLWLKANASTQRDTVFLECLGYIGFYSQLKMLDFPGLAAPEVVEARRALHTNDFDLLISALRPDWLVLRPSEIALIADRSPSLLVSEYRLERVFDVSGELASHPRLPGLPFLQIDQTFVVFRNNGARRADFP